MMKRHPSFLLSRGFWLIVISYWLFATGCQKVINIDLNSASPAIVIVGNINNLPGPYTVTLNQTVNFSQPNTFPPVNGAFVTIADNAGSTDTLTETPTPGVYQTKKIQGVPGRTYNLTVVANGQTYTSTSTMPQPVAFDTLLVFNYVDPSGDSTYLPDALFIDPPTGMHYYRLIETVNDTVLPDVFALDDEFNHGGLIDYKIYASKETILRNDSVKVELQGIDQGTYNYIQNLRQASGSTNVTPANPPSNISNNALGYFSAHTSAFRAIKVK